MPELPDITVYVEHLERRLVGAELRNVRIVSPNLLRTFEPALEVTLGLAARSVRRVGKRIAIELDQEIWLVLHLMISGRLHWAPAVLAGPRPKARRAAAMPAPRPGALRGGKRALAAFEFSTGTLSLTEASSKKRASLHVVRGAGALAACSEGTPR